MTKIIQPRFNFTLDGANSNRVSGETKIIIPGSEEGGGGGEGDPIQIMRWSVTNKTPSVFTLNGDGTVATYAVDLTDPESNNNFGVLLNNGNIRDLGDLVYFELDYFDFEIDGVPETGGTWAFGRRDMGLFGSLTAADYITEDGIFTENFKRVLNQLYTNESLYNLRETLAVINQHQQTGVGWESTDYPHTQPTFTDCYAIDFPNGKMWHRYNDNAWLGGGDPVAGTNPTWSPDGVSVSGDQFPADYFTLNGSEFDPSPSGDPQEWAIMAIWQWTTSTIFQQGGDLHSVKIGINGGNRAYRFTPPVGFDISPT